MIKSGNTESLQPENGKINIGHLILENGTTLPEVELAYERAGKKGAPVILVCHALTGSQFTVGTESEPGWWRGLIGHEESIDLNEYEIITFNVLGGCSGSTGPKSLNPETGKPYQYSFPQITIRDIVHSQYIALQELGIERVKAVIGGSLGGMQVLEWGLMYPAFAELLIPLAVTPYLSDYGIAFNVIGRNAIKLDPQWKGGFYSENDRIPGLEVARMAGMVTYRTSSLFNQRFNREPKVSDGGLVQEFQVESYLKYQGKKLAGRFDANSYLYLLQAMDSHDIGRNRQGWREALKRIQAKVILIGYTNDLLYPPEALKEMASVLQAAGKDASFWEVDTHFGHDGFLAEFDKWGEIIQSALR